MVANQDMLETKSARLEELEKKLEQAQQFDSSSSSSSSSSSPLKTELSAYSAKLQEKEVEVASLRREVSLLMDRVTAEKRAREVHQENLQVLEVKYEEARNRLDGSASEHSEEAMELQSRLDAKGAALVRILFSFFLSSFFSCLGLCLSLLHLLPPACIL
jgi:predicted  nucleic acid-binding Zn-ribbon protein